jgi:hypothetical protein
MPAAGSAEGAEAARAVQHIFDAHAVEGVVRVNYLTRAFVGRPG